MHTAAPGHSGYSWQAVRLDSALTVPAKQWLSGRSPWPEGCWKCAGSCQGFQTAVCYSPNSVELQKIFIRLILSPFWSFELKIHTVCWTQKS